MRRGFSPTRSKVAQQMATRRDQESRREQDPRRPTNPSINHWKYFCHYNNAVYQGGMSAYKKHGRGLLLHDDGAAVVTEYLHDTPTGHNIIFRDNSISSVLFKSSSDYEIAYKAGRCIIKIPFAQSSEKAHGLGVLIDFEFNKIYELVFKRGTLVQKILHLNRKNNEDAFKHSSITKLFGLKHEQAFSLTFEKPQTMHVKQSGNEITIGYFDEDGEVHGLAFRSYGQNIEVSGQKGLYLKSIERGYYKKSQLETYGQKFFSNGNKYVGEFQKGQFHGHGILVCPQEMKWVYGRFGNGKLTQVIDSNNKKYTENEFQMWTQGLLDIHKRYRQRWIDFNIELPDQPYLYNVLKDARKKQVTQVDPDYEQVAKEDQYRMGRIQQQFQEGFPGNYNSSYVDVELDKHYTVRSNKNSRIDTPSRRSRNDLKPPKQSIYIQDHHSSKERPYPIEPITPISKVTSTRKTPKNSPSSNEERGENHYRQQDPFQIQLVKVPMVQQPSNQRNKIKEKQKDPIRQEYQRPRPNLTLTESIPYRQPRQPRQPRQLRQPRQPRQSRQSRQSRQPPYSLRYSTELPNHYQGIYKKAYLNQLERHRDIYSRLERDDQDYMDYLRRGISRSPVHRDYYNTPPRYDPTSKRYSGRIVNKKTFNYQDPTDKFPRRQAREAERDIYPRDSSPPYRRDPSPPYFPSSRDPSPPPIYPRDPSPSSLIGNAPYRSPPGSKDSLGNSRSFIENNYQHWR